MDCCLTCYWRRWGEGFTHRCQRHEREIRKPESRCDKYEGVFWPKYSGAAEATWNQKINGKGEKNVL